jgi:hypothetical protein
VCSFTAQSVSIIKDNCLYCSWKLVLSGHCIFRKCSLRHAIEQRNLKNIGKLIPLFAFRIS